MLAGTDRYLAAVKLPNGTYALVNLKAVTYTKEEKEALFVEIVDKAKEIQAIKDDLKRNAAAVKYNEELSDKLFLSSYPGNLLDLKVGQDGSIFIQLDQQKGEEIVNIESVSIDFPVVNSDTSAVKIIESLITKYNKLEKVAANNAQVRDKNIRKSFASGAPAQDIVDKSTTEVGIEVVTDNSLVLSAESDAILAQQAVAFASVRPKNEDKRIEEEVALPEISEESDDSVLDMSEEELISRIDNDFQASPISLNCFFFSAICSGVIPLK